MTYTGISLQDISEHLAKILRNISDSTWHVVRIKQSLTKIYLCLSKIKQSFEQTKRGNKKIFPRYNFLSM